MIAALVLRGHGAAHAAAMAELDHAQITLALLRDGFHPESVGGRVRLDRYGHPQLDYPLTPYLFDGMRRAYLTMAELHRSRRSCQATVERITAKPLAARD